MEENLVEPKASILSNQPQKSVEQPQVLANQPEPSEVQEGVVETIQSFMEPPKINEHTMTTHAESRIVKSNPKYALQVSTT